MPPVYLTPRRYQSMGQGVDLSDIDDQDLASHIHMASGLVNSYCNVEISHDFRGGSVVGEEHEWKLGNYMWPASKKVYPDHSPLLDLEQFRIFVSTSQYLDIAPERVQYHKSENALIPTIAETSIGIWSYDAVPIIGYREPEAHITYTYGYRFSVADEQMFPDGGVTWRAMNQWWDESEDVVIKVNGAEIDSSDLTIDYIEGTVDIDDDALTDLDISVDEVDSVLASYVHKLPSNIMNATAITTTSLLGQRGIAARGMLGLSGIRVNEVEIRQSRDAQAARDMIPGVAQSLLTPFRRFSWGA